MSFLELNRAALSRYHPQALQRLDGSPGPGPRVRILETPSGVPTLAVDGLFYHSRYDPRRDADAAARREIDPLSTAVVVVGFGLGYGAEAARRLYPRLPLVVVEPDREVFSAAMACRDLSGFFAEPDVILYLDERPDGLPQSLEPVPLSRPAILRLRPAIQKNPLPYRAAEEVLQSWLLRKDINTNTLARFGRLWVRNLCRNMLAFADSPGIGTLAGMFEGIPALVVAGGPSLDSVIPLLPRLRERLLVVSVNTPLRPCLDAGVEPDFTVVVDPQFWASRYLDWTATRHGFLVAEPSTCPRVFRREGAPFFFCSSLFPLGEALEEATGVRGKLGAGGSVATSAWDLARLLGCRPLYAAGLDLGFPGMRTHCRGVFAEDAWLAASSRLDPVEGSSWRALRDVGLFPVRAAGGGTTPTDRRMLLYKWWFENQMKMAGAAESYTLSPGGAAIEGMPLVNPGRLIELPPCRGHIDQRMAEVRARHERRPPLRETAAALRARLDEVGAGLEELESLARQGLDASTVLAAALERGDHPGRAVRALDGIDRRILGLSARLIAGFLLQPLIRRIAAESENAEGQTAGDAEGGAGGADAVAARSSAVYEGIRESAWWQRQLLRRAAEGLRDESLLP